MELKKTTQLAWRRFMATDAGMEGMLWMRERCPTIYPNDLEHNIVFAAGRTAGFTEGLDKINEILSIKLEAPANESQD